MNTQLKEYTVTISAYCEKRQEITKTVAANSPGEAVDTAVSEYTNNSNWDGLRVVNIAVKEVAS